MYATFKERINKNMHEEKFINLILKELESNKDKLLQKPTSTNCEIAVCDAVKAVCQNNSLICNIDYTEGGHSFPDIICHLPNITIGIEVKSSIQPKNNNPGWTILGNSILGSTRKEVDENYLIFFKLNKNGLFIRSGKYEDAISDIVVTHSPRYKIDLDQSPSDSFFSRSNIRYEQLKKSSNPIGLITDYFKSQGATAWWLTDSSPATIQTWDEISPSLRVEILSKALVLFPELLTSSSTKYKRLAKWLVSEYSIADTSLRDRFSAGGKIDINFDNKIFKTQQIIKRLIEYREKILMQLNELPIETLSDTWNNIEILKAQTLDDRLSIWLTIISNVLAPNQLLIKFISHLFREVNRP